MPNFAQICRSAQCSAFYVNAGNTTGKKLENTLPGIRTISWSHVYTVRSIIGTFAICEVFRCTFFKSIFEMTLYLIKHPIPHPLLRNQPQDLRWVSSLYCRKHHTVKITMLNSDSALDVILVQLQNFTGQGFKMRILVSGKLLACGRTRLSHISLHFCPIPNLWHLLSCKGVEGPC